MEINYNLYSFSIICEEKNEDQILKIIKEIVKANKASINSIETSDTENGNIKLDICIIIYSDGDIITSEIMQKLPGRKDVISISLNKKDKRFLYEEEEL